MKKKCIKNIFQGAFLIVNLFIVTHAAPVVIEGAVPNEASKQEILNKMYIMYGQENIIDRIQVRAVTAPNGWSNAISHVITEDLKKVKQGKLKVRGTQMDLSGKLNNANTIQPMTAKFQSLVSAPYRLNAQLSVNQAEQQMIDAALKHRIIEFESGSATLTASGQQILDEMAIELNKVGGKKVKVIGHTDSSGDADKNLTLSQQRAAAVKNYLIGKNIAAENLTAEGFGSNQPVADNITAEGRRKNRRIEFEVQ
ncbi:OmpA family protein [Acinetobacter sp. C_4_1]|uniref:OmpA family protein n=1 Tax=unclassified Acinetobacter TaxID=196816 RepID=UPI0021B77260|nr:MULTISPECIES: OmpA family protein [unclassified Acinetobacter]MCT8088275.1 OmpA family protein [Acinetobacter sp. F_3_1]MCT8097644.1 OmpA family protein [Acinetobacter sp. C_3_1]MCT8100300.1 OmpA family protein [Acinetobacter sp. C_4_1]MCT8133981.1 OmpA family protein [Acinetobacter sp. T_3_1]